MKVNFLKIKNMVLVNIYGKIKVILLVNFKKIKFCKENFLN